MPAKATGWRARLHGVGTWLPSLAVLILVSLGGCASLPPGSSYPRVHSLALSEPQTTQFGRQFASDSRAHEGKSGFRIINVGVDGFLVRLEMINAAERTLDLQYYIFRGDESGRVLTGALLRAADRGVRVRVLVDDGETVAGDEQLLGLSGHTGIEIRVFNPWAYRGHNTVVRGTEYLLRHSRLDYRMHNKLLVADNSVALTGGRNIGDQYFQIDPESQFADDDVFAGGPITQQLSAKFDDFWNSSLAIPAEALGRRDSPEATSAPKREHKAARARKAANAGFNYGEKLAAGEPFAGILAGRLPLVWADAQIVCDSPDKKQVVSGGRAGSLTYEPVADAATRVRSELLMVTPYFIPSRDEVHLLEAGRQKGVRVRVLTNSLESTPDLSAHSGYMHYRTPLLQDGVEFHEVRSLPGNSRGSGQSARLSRYGNYGLHGKLFVFDREKLYIGSMNFDQRSRHLNTEIGLIIASPALSEQTAARFEAMAQEENSYAVTLRPAVPSGSPRLVWRTREGDKSVEYDSEPARSTWQKFRVNFLSLLPLDSEL
ncbi:MAG: phospholipase [Gammaproteobacteria bacterium]|nr:phospholipase [Gammaproteobacteria bacterium]